MYAVVSTGGKQLKVEKGSVAVVEKLDAAVGESVTLEVLFVASEDSIIAGVQATSATVVKATVLEHFAGDKITVFKFKKRKGYKRTKGHRQLHTRIRVTDVELGTKADTKTHDKPKKVAPKADAPKGKIDTSKEKADTTKETASDALCCATKSSGEPCKNKAKEGSQFCGVHSRKSGE